MIRLIFLGWTFISWMVVGGAIARQQQQPQSSSSVLHSSSSLERKVVDWLKSREGGFVSSKIEIRSFYYHPDNKKEDGQTGTSSSSSCKTSNFNSDAEPAGTTTCEAPKLLTGIFAKDDIEEGEILIDVPWDSLIESGRDGKVWDRKTYLSCGTVQNLIDEVKKYKYRRRNNGSSEFGPYMEYLQKSLDEGGIIPSSWSSYGQELLIDILGGECSGSNRVILPPFHPTYYLTEWIQICQGSMSDMDYAAIVLSRADDDLLVPVYDFFNHNNDPTTGNMITVERMDGKYHRTKAKRKILKGEQIYNSYNLCDHCGIKRHNTYGTAELFQDYGFIESMPQRWYFFRTKEKEPLRLELDYENDDDGHLVIGAKWNDGNDAFLTTKRQNAIKQFFIHELRRLERLQRRVNSLKDSTTKAHSLQYNKVPINEWTIIWQYYDALVNAMTLGLESLGSSTTEICPSRNSRDNGGLDSRDLCSHYIELTEEDDIDMEDDLPYELSTTCGRSNTPKGFHLLETVVTTHDNVADDNDGLSAATTTTINFQQKGENPKEICLFENNELIICPKSRPYVYEPLVHLPGHLLRQVQRVLIVGGGNGMALYEVLKYSPELQHVIIIEEHQQLARKSFEYFGTHPYFDNELVEWWFGGIDDFSKFYASKEKDLLDLIILDYVVGVIKEETIEKLGCLLNEDHGILTAYSNNMKHLRRFFQYTLQLFPFDYAVVGKYGLLVLASHTVNFHQIEVWNHGIEKNAWKDLNSKNEFFYMTHMYYKNTHPVKRDCAQATTNDGGAFEVTDIVEIAHTGKRTNNIQASLRDALSVHGHKILSEPSGDEEVSFTLIFEEGYIVVNKDESGNGYVGFNIHQWNTRTYTDSTQLLHLLLDTLRVKSFSLFRLINKHRDDNKEDSSQPTATVSSQEVTNNFDKQQHVMIRSQQWVTSTIFAEPFLNLSVEVVAVVCGGKEQDCQSYNAINDISTTGSVIKFWMCPELDDGADKLVGTISRTALEDCERTLMGQLDKISKNKKINIVVIDQTVGKLMLQVVDSLMSSTSNRLKWLGMDYLFLAISFGKKANSSRRAFLDRIRQYINVYPVARVEYVFESEKSAIEFGVVTSANGNSFGSFVTLQKNFNTAFASAYNQTSIQVVNFTSVVGGTIGNDEFAGYDPGIDPETLYNDNEADNEESEEIHTYQTLVRLRMAKVSGDAGKPFVNLVELLKATYSDMNLWIDGQSSSFESSNDDHRTTIVLTLSDGISVVSYDGSVGVTIHHQGPDVAGAVIRSFLSRAKTSSTHLEVLSANYFPRGLGVWKNPGKTSELKLDLE